MAPPESGHVVTQSGLCRKLRVTLPKDQRKIFLKFPKLTG